MAESAWHRAYKDTENFRQNSKWYFWLVEIVGGGALFGIMGDLVGWKLMPQNANASQQNVYPLISAAIGVVIGFVIIFVLIFTWNLFRAPYRQRNEALALLEKKPKPVPLSNKEQLIRTIGALSQKALSLILKQELLNWLNTQSPRDRNWINLAEPEAELARIEYESALGQLVNEKLVAGNTFRDAIEPFELKVKARTFTAYTKRQSIGAFDYYSEKNQLDNLANNTVQRINEINQQVSDKVDSQT